MAIASTPGLLNPIKQILLVVCAYLSAEIFLVACAFFWVFIYSMFINPGGDNAFYESYSK